MLCIGDRPWVGRSVMGSRDPKGCGGMPIKRRRAAARRPAGDGIRQNTQGLTDSQSPPLPPLQPAPLVGHRRATPYGMIGVIHICKCIRSGLAPRFQMQLLQYSHMICLYVYHYDVT